MKKVLISILIVLLLILAYFAIFNGLSIGNINVLSASQIAVANEELTKDIEKAKTLLKKDYPAKKEELSTSITDLLEKKEEYFGLAKISSDKEITKANTEETYLIEYLWTRIGRHATSKGVNIKMDVSPGDANEANIKDLSFTVNGEYIGIINFISSLENDEKLNFKIEGFKMLKNTSNLTATFIVKNIRIKVEKMSDASTQTDTENNNSNEVNNENTTNETSKFDQVTGAVDNALAPAE